MRTVHIGLVADPVAPTDVARRMATFAALLFVQQHLFKSDLLRAKLMIRRWGT